MSSGATGAGAGAGSGAGRGQLPGEPHEGDAESEPLALAICSSEFLHVVSSVFGEEQQEVRALFNTAIDTRV